MGQVSVTVVKLSKATVSFFRTVCLSVWNNSAPTTWIFMRFCIWRFFNICRENSSFIQNLTRIRCTLHEELRTSVLPSLLILFKTRNFQTEITEKTKYTIYTGCPRRNGQNFGRVFLMLNYNDITQNTYTQSWTVTEIMAKEVWNFDSCYTLTDYQIHIKTCRNMWFL